MNKVTPPTITDTEKLLFISGRLDAKSDSGKHGDAITNCATPSFSGFATPNANAFLILNGKKHPIISDSEGKWSLKLENPLTDGIYDVTFKITDANGKTVESKTTLTIDTALDGLSVGLDKDSDSGVVGDNITNNTLPIINGKTEPGTIVTVEINDTTLKTIANADGFWSVVPLQSLIDGVYKYSVTATDAAGNTATITKEVTIDTTAPDATILLSSASDSGTKDDFITNVSLPILSGTTDNGATIQLTFDGQTYTIIADSNGNWSFTPAASLHDGVYAFTAQVTDLAGNTASHAGNLTIDSQIPTVTANLAPATDSGLSDHDNITNNKHPTLTGVTKANATLTITLDGQHYSVIADKEGRWSWSVPDSITLNQGLNSYAISVSDAAGNTTKVPFAGSFIFDTTLPPTSTIGFDPEYNSGDKDDAITNVNTPVFIGQSEPFSQVTVIVDNHTYSVRADITGAWRLELLEELHDGTYDVEIYATDLAGNVSIDKTIWAFEIDTSIPTATAIIEAADDTGVSDSDGVTQNKQPTFTGVTTANADITLNIGGNEYHTVADDNGLWRISLPTELTDNVYSYDVTVVNKAGTSATTTGTLVIDTISPSSDASLSKSSDSGQNHSDNITNVVKPTLTGKTEPYSIIEVQFEGNSYSPTVAADGEWILTLPAKLNDGSYIYTVVATDLAGNTSSSEHHFVIDTVSELTAGLDLSSIMEGAGMDTITNLARPMLSGVAEPGSIVTVCMSGNKYLASVDDTGRWTFTLPKDAVAGINNYSVTSEDLAGNKTILSGNFTYISSGILPPRVTVQLAPDSDSGVIGDAITNHSTPTFIGNATPGCLIVLVINGYSYTTTASATDGCWSIDVLNTLREGYSDYIVTATDPSTSLSTTLNSGIYIDTLNPNVTINLTDDTDTGIKGDMITKNRKPIFTGKTEAGAKVLLHIDDEDISTIADGNGNWTLTSPREFPANYQASYTVTVTDLAGNETSQAGALVIDNTAPYLSGSQLDSSSDTGIKDDYWTNQLTPTLTGRTEPGCKLTIRIQGTIYDITDIASDGTWKFTVPAGVIPINTSYYTIHFWVTATDTAGNSTTTNDKVYSARYHLGLTGTLSEDTDTDVKGDNLTSNKTPTLEGKITSEDNAHPFTGTIEINSKTYPVKIYDNQTKWSFSIPDSDALTSGIYDYTVKFVDRFGEVNIFKSSITISHLVGHLVPEDDTGTVGDNQTSGISPSLTGQSIAGAILRIEINGETHTIPVNSDGTWTFQVPNAPLCEGVYNYKLTEIFNGKTTTYSNSFTIDFTPPDITAGLSSSTHTPDDATVTQSDKPIIEGKSSPNQEVIILIEDKRFSTVSSADGSWRIELNDLNLRDGASYSYTVISSDGAGNTGQFTGSFSTHLSRPTVTAGTYQDGVENINENQTNFLYMNKIPPILMGKGSPGDTIDFFNYRDNKYTTTVNDDGTWSIETDADAFGAIPSQGAYYTWKLNVTDNYGISTSYTTRLIYDSVPPTLTATLDSSSNTGVANDDITCKKQPMLSGTTDANQTITLTLYDKDYTIRSDDTGKWSFTVPDELHDGMYDYTVKATDKAGNNTTVSGSFTVNTTPVSVDGSVDTLADPNMNNGWSNIHHQILKGTSTPSSTVVITINGDNYNPVIQENGDWILELTNLANGNYNYVVTAMNIAGNQSSITGGFNIDDTIPTTTVSLSTATDSGTLGDFITNNLHPVFVGKTKSGAMVTLVINNETYTVTADSSGNWTIPVSQELIHGSYNYTVSIVDLAKNSSDPFNGSVKIETVLPTGTITAALDPDSDSGIKGDAITSTQTPNITGNAPAGSIVVLSVGAHTYKTVASATGSWKMAITDPLSEGMHNYNVYIEDIAGNQSAAITGSVTIDCNIILDISGLSLTTDSGVKGDYTTNVAMPTLTGTAEPGSAIQLIIKADIYTTTANAEGQWSVTLSDSLPDGNYLYSVSATDIAGNVITDTNELIIDTIAPAQLTGSLSADSETGRAGSNITNEQCPTFTGTTENGATVTLTINSKSYTGTAGSDGQWTIVIPDSDPLSDGLHSYTIKTQDASGNVCGIVVSGNVTVKHTPPSAQADLQAGSDTGIIGNHLTSDTQPLLSGKTATGAAIVIVFAGVNYPVTVNAAGDWSFRIPTVLAQGNYNYQVIATDNAGNTSAFNGEFSIDTTPPVAPDASLAENSDSGSVGDCLTNDNTPTLTGSCEAGATVTLMINSKTYITTAKTDGTWSITLPDADTLQDKTYDYTVTATDGAGNISPPL
ncbi:Ig-like domain repeat protein, partial [Salmonella enterica subsp. enterica]|nr:Ig-like domain repeat protein [Salmonella enterica subsp. enterica]